MLGVDPDAGPWDDPSIRNKVRWMGVAFAVLSLAAVLAGLTLLRRPQLSGACPIRGASVDELAGSQSA
jgi:hypothetical protein